MIAIDCKYFFTVCPICPMLVYRSDKLSGIVMCKLIPFS